MTELATKECVACRADAPKVSDERLAELIKEIPDWTPIVRDDVMQLERIYKFKNFKRALDFSVRVGVMADVEGHHPEITTEWGKTTVRWWTHAINGLHENDFICAAKTDVELQAYKATRK